MGYTLTFDIKSEIKTACIRKGKAKRKVAAFALPVPEYRSEYAEKENLPLEFLFPDEILERNNSKGYGLRFGYPTVILENRGKVDITPDKALEAGICTLADRQILSGKEVFSGEIIQDVAPEYFETFRYIFEIINQLIEELT